MILLAQVYANGICFQTMSKINSLQERFFHFRTTVLRISQTEMAAKLGLTPSAVGRWEKAENRTNEPSGRILWQLVRQFRLNPDWLFEGMGSPLLPETIRNDKMPQDTNTLSLIWQPEPIAIPIELVAANRMELKKLSDSIEEFKILLQKTEGNEHDKD